MMSGRIAVRLGVVMVSFGLLVGVGGCAGKRVASTSGDQSMTTKGKADTETVRQEPMASVETPSPSEGLSSAGMQSQEGSERQMTPSVPGSSSVPSRRPAPSGSMVPSSKTIGSPMDLIGLGDIYFDFDRYNIRQDAQPVLETDAKWLRVESGKSILLEGHCDERGTSAYNLVLGEKRAKSAKRYLEDLGIPSSRVQTISYGKERPFCKEHNDGCWQSNRRAHFVAR